MVSERVIRSAILVVSAILFGIMLVVIFGKMDLTVQGNGVAQLSQETRISAECSGVISYVLPIEKRSVERGQPLAVIVRSDLMHRIGEISDDLKGVLIKVDSLGEKNLLSGGEVLCFPSFPAQIQRIGDRLSSMVSELRGIREDGSKAAVGAGCSSEAITDTICAPVQGVLVGRDPEHLAGKFFVEGEKMLTIRHPPQGSIFVALPPKSFVKVKVGQRASVSIKSGNARKIRCIGTVSELVSRRIENSIALVARIEPGEDWADASELLISPTVPGIPWQVDAKAEIIVEKDKPIYRLLWDAAFHRAGKS